ncbi:terminase small subunit [Pseudescherichia vulneris]
MSKLDESGLKRDYCAGLLSLREIAGKFGIAESTLRYLAKKNGWVRANKIAQKNSAQKNKKSPVPRINKDAATAQKVAQADPQRSAYLSLSEQEREYVSHFLDSRNKYEAYRNAGYTGGERNARMLYRKPAIARAINEALAVLCRQLELRAEDVLRQWEEIVQADPGEISQHRRVNCRYCWGLGHRYQWRDEDELEAAEARASQNGDPPPDNSGGFGFIGNDDPNQDCPRCCGEGIADVFITDSRDLSPQGRQLFAGVKQTKFGIEVLTQDKDSARKNLMQFYNLAGSETEREKNILELEYLRIRNEQARLELEKLKNPEDEDDPTPVVVSINVVDARKRADDADDSAES